MQSFGKKLLTQAPKGSKATAINTNLSLFRVRIGWGLEFRV